MLPLWQRVSAALASVALVTACAGAATERQTTVLSFADLDCATCGEEMAQTLIEREGVYKTGFDKRKAELTVIADQGLDVLALAQKNKPPKEEWRLVAGPGKGNYIPWQTAAATADVKQIAMDGEDVADLAPHLALGKITIVDFSAKWCEPCRELDAHVLKLAAARTDIAYRKLDVGDWDTPLGKRYLKGVKELPYVLFFDRSGKQVETQTGLDLAKLDATLARLSASPATEVKP